MARQRIVASVGMSLFLDRLLGSPAWAALALVVFLALLFLVLRVAAPAWVRANTNTLIGTSGLIALAWFLVIIVVNPAWWGYGPTIAFTDLRVDERSVVLLDFVNQSGGEHADPIPHHRVHELDVRDGRRRYRMLVGSDAHLVGLTPSEVVVRRDTGEYVYVDRLRGAITARLDRDDVGTVVPGLAGLGPIEWTSADDERIVVSTLDGTTRTISVRDRALVTKTPTEPARTDALEVSSDAIRSGYATRLALRAKDGEPRRLHPVAESGAARDEAYVDGTFVAVTRDASVAVVLHYATIEKRAPRLTGIALATGAPVWSLESELARPAANDWEALVRTALARDGRTLAIAVDAHVLLLDAITGRVHWVRDFGAR